VSHNEKVRAVAMLAILAAAFASAQPSRWRSPIPIGRIEISPTAEFAFISDWADGNYILNLRKGTWTPCSCRQLQFSADDKYAVGVVRQRDDTSALLVYDLRSGGKISMSLPGSNGFFAPTGDTLCVQNSVDPSELDLYELPNKSVRKVLRGFNEEIDMRSRRLKPFGILLKGWTQDGIELSVSVPNDAGLLTFYVDPDRDIAVQDSANSYYGGVKLADGSEVRESTPDSDVFLATWWGQQRNTTLFTRKDSGPAFPELASDLKLARHANVLVVNAVSQGHSMAAIWGINVVNGRNSLILKKPWPRQAKDLDYISVDVSPDGKWILYRDFDDQKLLDRAAMPIVVYDLSTRPTLRTRAR